MFFSARSQGGPEPTGWEDARESQARFGSLAGLLQKTERVDLVQNDFLRNEALLHPARRRKLVHQVEHQLFHDQAQTASPDLAFEREPRDRFQGLLVERQLDVLVL